MNFLHQITPLLWLLPLALLCLGCIGSGNSSASQAQTTATGEGVTQGTHGTVARDQSLALGSGARITSGNITADKGAIINVGVQPGDVSNLLTQFSSGQQSSTDALAKLLAAQQTQIGTLAQNAQTGTNQSQDHTVAWISAGALIVAYLLSSDS